MDRGIVLLRRLLLLAFLALALVGTVALSRWSANWHYTVPVQPGGLLYIATFDGFNEDWQQYDGRLAAKITDGSMRLEVDDVNAGPFSVAAPYFSDFDARVEAQAVGGPVNNGFGLIFRFQDKNNTRPEDDSYYLFLVSSDGYYEVRRVVAGRTRELSTWIDSPQVQQGIGATNYLRVVAKGDVFHFFINNQPVQLCVPEDSNGVSTYALNQCIKGQMVDSLTDDSIADGRLGVVATTLNETGSSVAFDNLVVYGPQ
jgi:3-keto-disaccharide hydrolase